MTVGSATWHGPKDCLLADACLGNAVERAGACAEAVGNGDYSAVREDGKHTADEAAEDGKHCDALGEKGEIDFHINAPVSKLEAKKTGLPGRFGEAWS